MANWLEEEIVKLQKRILEVKTSNLSEEAKKDIIKVLSNNLDELIRNNEEAKNNLAHVQGKLR